MSSSRSCIYSGYVSHSRHIVDGSSSASNSFRYPVMYLYLDLTEIEHAFSHIPFASINRLNIISWYRSHYVGDPTVPLHEFIKDLVASHCGKRPDESGKVCLLTLPTQFGYGFNPVSVFYCFDAANSKIQAIVCEVHNTPWLETHCYVLPFFDDDSERNENVTLYTARWPKAFHVSPFYAMHYEYVWSFNNPNNEKKAFKSFGSLLTRKQHGKKRQRTDEKPEIKRHGGLRAGAGGFTSSLAKRVDLSELSTMCGSGNDEADGFVKAFDFGFQDMQRLDMNKKNMLLFCVYFPVICCLIQLWIHWQAFKVYLKGISVKQHPQNKYVNPFTFWIKHSLIFAFAMIGNIFSWMATCIAQKTKRRKRQSP